MSTPTGPRVNQHGHECWIIETSKDWERWRFLGKAWKRPGAAFAYVWAIKA